MNEKQLHKQVATYIKLQYPNVLFNVDLSGIRLTPGLAKQAKELRSSRGFPDIVIYEQKKGYAALFIELKKEGTKLTKKNSHIHSSEHIEEQHILHQKLKAKGYYASFAVGFQESIDLIDWYLKD